MWLATTMQPPVAGIFSPSIQVREVAASSVGLMRRDGEVHRPAALLLCSFPTRHANPS